MKKLLLIIFFLIFATGGVIFLKKISASTTDNISGYAWSENIGWISFNSLSDGSEINYGVNINQTTGELSGYAWSENIGWISLNRSDTGNPPYPPFNTGEGAIAKYNPSTGEITGWMRVLATDGSWDGWIRFCDTTFCPSDKIARIDQNGDWHGWAWGSEVVGWISFNSQDPDAGGANYKVSMATLHVSLSASPSSGYAPLNNVDLEASVTGSTEGSITYKFDCENDGIYEQIITTTQTTYTAQDLCDYSSPSTYTAKVEVERQGLIAQDTTQIYVAQPQHYECQNFQCVLVPGAGPNECQTNEDCKPPFPEYREVNP